MVDAFFMDEWARAYDVGGLLEIGAFFCLSLHAKAVHPMSSLSLAIGNKNYSSWSLRAWLSLKQTGQPFTETLIPLDLPETRSQLLQHSPTGLVPAFRHGDIQLWESIAICEYLAETFPEAQLWPRDKPARALARAVSAEMHAGFAPLRRHMPMDCRSHYPDHLVPEDVRANIDRICQLWRHCRQLYGGQVGDRGFLFGHFTIADAMYAPVVTRFRTYDVELDALCEPYAQAIWSHPPMQEWLDSARQEPWTLEDP